MVLVEEGLDAIGSPQCRPGQRDEAQLAGCGVTRHRRATGPERPTALGLRITRRFGCGSLSEGDLVAGPLFAGALLNGPLLNGPLFDAHSQRTRAPVRAVPPVKARALAMRAE